MQEGIKQLEISIVINYLILRINADYCAESEKGENKMEMFNPNNEAPKTDDEVILSLKRNDKELETALVGIYKCRRGLGDSIEIAYMKALLAHIEAFNQKSTTENYMPEGRK